MATKQSLINNLSKYDVDTLSKLLKYADLILIPDEDLASNVTMQQLVDKAHNLADTYFPEWTDRSKSDFGEFLVELFALFSEKDFWYINAFANESILQKMRSYSNAFMKSISMGYTPTTSSPATLEAKINFSKATTSEIMNVGSVILIVDGKEFFNNKKIQISNTDTSITTTFSEGSHNTESYTFNGYCIFIRQTNVNIDSIGIEINGVTWERVKNFAGATSSSLYFLPIADEDGSVVIYFGNDGVGKTPDIGDSVSVTYDTCNGSEGNVAGDECSLSSSTLNHEISSVSLASAPTGGTDAESLSSLVANAQLYVNNHGSVINVGTGENILKSIDFVFRAKISSVGFTMTYFVLPFDKSQASTTQKTFLKKNFEPKVLMGYNISFKENTFVDIIRRLEATKLKVTVYTSGKYDTTSINSQVKSIIMDFSNPWSKADYGTGFIRATILNYILANVSGVMNVLFQYTNTKGEVINMPDININDTELLSPLSSDNIEVTTYANI